MSNPNPRNFRWPKTNAVIDLSQLVAVLEFATDDEGIKLATLVFAHHATDIRMREAQIAALSNALEMYLTER